MPVKRLKLKIKETICIFHYLNKLSVLRVCPGVLLSLPLPFISVATEVPRLSWPQYPGHRVVTEPGLALHHQHVTWPRRARACVILIILSDHLSRSGVGTVWRLGPPIRNIAGRPRLMETRGAARLSSLWSVWPGSDIVAHSDSMTPTATHRTERSGQGSSWQWQPQHCTGCHPAGRRQC